MKDGDYLDAKKELISHALLAVGADPSAIIARRMMAGSFRANLDPNTFREGFQSACRLLQARWPSGRKIKNVVPGKLAII